MRLSIITINYNNRDGLQKTIDSVISQIWRDFEWIVIDGGSTDGSKELIEQNKSYFAYWCSEPDNGIYNAMNKGIAKAQGEYLFFLNSGDCLHEKDTLSKVFCHQELADVVYGDVNRVSNYSSYIHYYPHKLTTHYLITDGLCHQATFIRATLLKGYGYREDLKQISDWYKTVEWFRQGKTFAHTGLIIADYDMNGISSIAYDKSEEDILHENIFGKENIRWVEESIEMQRMFDLYNNEDMQRAFRIKEYGGKKLKWMFHWMLRLLNKTF